MFSAVESLLFISSSGFSCFCHRVCLRTRKPQKLLISNFLTFNRGIKTLYYFEHFSKHSECSGHNSRKAMLKRVKENLPLKLESSFAFLRPNCYLDIKLIAFSQFPRNGNRKK